MASTAQRDHLAAARERLATMTTELRESASWLAMLRMQQSFHQYSLSNTYLIYSQCPHASYLKGFKGWLELGRAVRKGETSIRIMAPRPYSVPTIDAEGNSTEDARMTFAMVSVFDYGQTDPIDGHPNPFTIPERLSVAGDPEAAQDAYHALAVYLAADGVTITNEPPRREERGWYRRSERRINVSPSPAPDMLGVLVHEAAHHATTGVGDDYAEREVVAQSVAYLVLDGLGLDAGAVSADYLAGWIGTNPERLSVAVSQIISTADAFLDAIKHATHAQIAA